MRIKVGTFNPNNLSSRVNFSAEVAEVWGEVHRSSDWGDIRQRAPTLPVWVMRLW